MASRWQAFTLLSVTIYLSTEWLLCSSSKGDRDKRDIFMHTISDEVYQTLLLLAQGRFNVPVKDRTRVQKSTVIRFWRWRYLFNFGQEREPTLYFGGLKVVKQSSVSAVVGKMFHDAKSGGCKKLRNRAAESYAGLTERKILRITSNELKYRIHNAKFRNKGTPRPVRAKHVQSQHQIDLIDLRIHHFSFHTYI